MYLIYLYIVYSMASGYQGKFDEPNQLTDSLEVKKYGHGGAIERAEVGLYRDVHTRIQRRVSTLRHAPIRYTTHTK